MLKFDSSLLLLLFVDLETQRCIDTFLTLFLIVLAYFYDVVVLVPEQYAIIFWNEVKWAFNIMIKYRLFFISLSLNLVNLKGLFY